jgi:hypothetical protein
MTNKISSAVDAIPALMVLKAKSVPVRVNVSFPNTALSFEGKVIGIDETSLQISGVTHGRDFSAPLFRISPLSKFAFRGEWRLGEHAVSLALLIGRVETMDDPHAFKIHISAEWPPGSWYQTSGDVN